MSIRYIEKLIPERIIIRTKKPSSKLQIKEVRLRCPYLWWFKIFTLLSTFIYQMKLPPFVFIVLNVKRVVLNQQSFRDMQIFDTELSMNVINANKERKELSEFKKFHLKRKNLVNEIYNTPTTINSLKYINNRFGVEFPPIFLQKFKCILDPQAFLMQIRLWFQIWNSIIHKQSVH